MILRTPHECLLKVIFPVRVKVYLFNYMAIHLLRIEIQIWKQVFDNEKVIELILNEIRKRHVEALKNRLLISSSNIILKSLSALN